MASCGLLRLAVAGCGWLQVAMVGQRLAMAGWAWQRLAKMCLLLSNTARVGDEGVSQVGRPDCRSKREASIGLALCGVKRVDKDMSMA